MTQKGGAQNTFFSATLYNFQKSGRAIAPPAPPPSAVLGKGNELQKNLCLALFFTFK